MSCSFSHDLILLRKALWRHRVMMRQGALNDEVAGANDMIINSLLITSPYDALIYLAMSLRRVAATPARTFLSKVVCEILIRDIRLHDLLLGKALVVEPLAGSNFDHPFKSVLVNRPASSRTTKVLKIIVVEIPSVSVILMLPLTSRLIATIFPFTPLRATGQPRARRQSASQVGENYPAQRIKNNANAKNDTNRK